MVDVVSAPAAPAQTDRKAVTAIPPMRVFIKGRVEASRMHEGVRYTRVITPAPDAYSRPQMLEVRSRSKIGERGEDVQFVAVLGGFQRKAYSYTDKDTGERLSVVPVDHTLDLVESD